MSRCPVPLGTNRPPTHSTGSPSSSGWMIAVGRRDRKRKIHWHDGTGADDAGRPRALNQYGKSDFFCKAELDDRVMTTLDQRNDADADGN